MIIAYILIAVIAAIVFSAVLLIDGAKFGVDLDFVIFTPIFVGLGVFLGALWPVTVPAGLFCLSQR